MSRAAAEIAELQKLERSDLLARWSIVFGQQPPSSLSANLLRSGISYELQSRETGGPGKRVKAELDRAAKGASTHPACRPRAGAQLVREWNGAPHIVDIVEGGYRYRDRTFRSLTAIAFEITGARWSGPRFFGLKSRTAK